MASPLEIYTAWQSRQMAGDVEHLGEVVDLEGFRDICIGLSYWTTGYAAAFDSLRRNILIPLPIGTRPSKRLSRGRMRWWCVSVQRPRTWLTSSVSGDRSPRELGGRGHGESQGRSRG
jgi:hypothetical protein